MRRILAIAIVALLAGCGGEPEREAPAEGRQRTTPVVNQAELDRVPPEASPTPAPAPTPAEAGTIAQVPDAWRGTWAGEGGNCAAGSDLRLQVAPDRLLFFEAEAVATRIERLSEREIQLDLSFSGEGQSWTKRNVLALGDDGDALVRSEDGMPTVRYRRCPVGAAE